MQGERAGGLLGLVAWSIEVSGEKLKCYRDTRGPGLEGVRCLLAGLERRRDGKAIRDRAIVCLLLFDLASIPAPIAAP